MSDAMFNYMVMDSSMRDMARELVLKYEELKHIDPEKILFIWNHSSRDKKRRLAKTSHIALKWQEVMYQKGSCAYWFLVEFFFKTTQDLDRAQLTALMYRELRKISNSGEVCEPDTIDWYDMISCLGKSWADPACSCVDLLADDTPKTIFTGGRPRSDD